MLYLLLRSLPLIAAGTCALAQVPDAGSLQRETERGLQAPHPPPAPGAGAHAQPHKPDAQAERVLVLGIVIEGARLLPDTELSTLVDDAIGQRLALAELEHLAQRIAELYRERGWYARAYLPTQDVTDGVLRIRVVEGIYKSHQISGNATRADGARIAATVTRRLRPGQPLSSADLERGLLLANDLPGVRVTGTLQPGSTEGETGLDIAVQDRPLVSADAGINNYGMPATGRTQVVGGLALNNPSGGGDQLALRALAARHIASATLRYQRPLGSDGLTLAAHGSALSYRLAGSYRTLQARGEAYNAGLTLTYPLLRQTERNLQLSAGWEHRRYDDDLLGSAAQRRRINAATLALSGNLHDGLAGGAINWAGVQLTHGRLAIGDVGGDAAQDAASARSAGGYTKLAWQLNRLQRLGGPWLLQASLSGQWADNNLASSERFTLGGPGQVRAYPVSEASGDAGLLARLELQYELGGGWQVSAFYDAGRIRQHRRPWTGWNAGTGQPNSYHLQGAGLGLSWRHQDWQLGASVAAPLGGNPGEDALGRNTDGSRASSARGWLNLYRLF